jgi:hypothetical protein
MESDRMHTGGLLGGPGGLRRLSDPESGSGSGNPRGPEGPVATGDRTRTLHTPCSPEPEPDSGREGRGHGRRRCVTITDLGRLTLSNLERLGELSADPRMRRGAS